VGQANNPNSLLLAFLGRLCIAVETLADSLCAVDPKDTAMAAGAARRASTELADVSVDIRVGRCQPELVHTAQVHRNTALAEGQEATDSQIYAEGVLVPEHGEVAEGDVVVHHKALLVAAEVQPAQLG